MGEYKFDAIIVGGGVLGLSLAYHLTARRQEVLVLEREVTPGMHASGKNAGMIRQLYRHPQLTDWAKRSIELWPFEIRTKAFEQTGSYIVGRQKPSHNQEIFEDVELNGDPAVYTKSDGLLDPGIYMQELCRAAILQRAVVRKLARVGRAYRNGSKWCVEVTPKETYQAPLLINATGAWINSFIEIENGIHHIAAKPFARHLFAVVGWDEDFMPAPHCGFYWDEIRNFYMRKWEQDARLVSICDQSPADPDLYIPDSTVKERLAELLCELFPQMAPELRIATSWHCFRTYTEDKLPVWGPDHQVEQLFWLAAFGGLGMSTSFAATLDAARLICGEDVSVTSAFSPERLRNQSSSSTSADDTGNS